MSARLNFLTICISWTLISICHQLNPAGQGKMGWPVQAMQSPDAKQCPQKGPAEGKLDVGGGSLSVVWGKFYRAIWPQNTKAVREDCTLRGVCEHPHFVHRQCEWGDFCLGKQIKGLVSRLLTGKNIPQTIRIFCSWSEGRPGFPGLWAAQPSTLTKHLTCKIHVQQPKGEFIIPCKVARGASSSWVILVTADGGPNNTLLIEEQNCTVTFGQGAAPPPTRLVAAACAGAGCSGWTAWPWSGPVPTLGKKPYALWWP